MTPVKAEDGDVVIVMGCFSNQEPADAMEQSKNLAFARSEKRKKERLRGAKGRDGVSAATVAALRVVDGRVVRRLRGMMLLQSRICSRVRGMSRIVNAATKKSRVVARADSSKQRKKRKKKKEVLSVGPFRSSRCQRAKIKYGPGVEG